MQGVEKDPSSENDDLPGELQRLRGQLAELRARETYFRHLSEYALDLITILDADGTIRFESRSIETVLGWKPEDYLGRNAFDFVHPDDAPRVMQAFLGALQSHGHTDLLSFRFRHCDGSYRILEGRGNNLLEDSAVQGIVFNSRDVTERRRLEEQLAQSQKIQALGQLTGGVAHDFNNILTAILGYSELALVRLDARTPEAAAVREIHAAGERAAGLTRQLLAFSRKQVLEPKVLNLADVVQHMDKMLRRLLGGAIQLVTQAAPALHNVKVDLHQVEQVLLNLAVNAGDAMHGQGRLTIELSNARFELEEAARRPEIGAGDYVLLSVQDTGCGIPPEIRTRIFEPFFTTKDPGKGTGLGLATCIGVVKQSGGFIDVVSEVGAGTTFLVYLPRTCEAISKEPVAVAPLPVLAAAQATVLLVEDEVALRELAQTVLIELGYEVLVAEDGCDALRVMQEHPNRMIDLLLTDVAMPHMGGPELAQRLRPLQPKAKIIFCSGHTEDAILQSGSLEADVFFLPKPYSVAGFSQKISDVLAR